MHLDPKVQQCYEANKVIIICSILEYVFRDCLFSLDERAGSLAFPKCKHPETRTSAFKLLYELCVTRNNHLAVITRLLQFQIAEFDDSELEWEYNPPLLTRANCGFVGLSNLGSTCYMNSFMQQLFMIPKLRRGILAAPCPSENRDDNLLYQSQRLLGFLQESEEKFYSTVPFCHAFKDSNGQAMNVFVQMDVDEYFQTLFDRLENILDQTANSSMIKSQFEGATVQQIKSSDCEHISEKEELFYSLQCDVKGKKDVVESLLSFIEGEVLDGDNKYFCERCSKKVNAVKRTCIKYLPDQLIISLKRFEFDFEQFRRVKVNDFFEFPCTIDMRRTYYSLTCFLVT